MMMEKLDTLILLNFNINKMFLIIFDFIFSVFKNNLNYHLINKNKKNVKIFRG